MKKNDTLATIVGVALAAAAASSALAAPISITAPYQFLDNVSPNFVGLSSGLRQQFGSTCVVKVGNPCTPQNIANALGTTVSATQDGLTVNVQFVASALTSNHWAYVSPLAAGLPAGSWTLTARNGSDQATAVTPTLAGATAIGFAQGVNVVQNGSSPTFHWSYPEVAPGSSIDAVRFLVRDVTDIRSGVATIIYQADPLPPTATTYTVVPNDGHYFGGHTSLQPGRSYSIELQLQDTRNNTTNGAFANVLSQSRTHLYFGIESGGSPPTYLPMIDGSGSTPVYRFSGVPVIAGETVFIDPEVAVGFDYAIGVGDPLFRSVTLPAGVGDGLYDLWLWGGAGWVDTGIELTGGDEFLFAAGGIDRFRITGIERSAGIDPFSAGNFTTGLSFVASGTFNGTMTPIIANAVPVGSTAVLAISALVALGGRRRRVHARR